MKLLASAKVPSRSVLPPKEILQFSRNNNVIPITDPPQRDFFFYCKIRSEHCVPEVFLTHNPTGTLFIPLWKSRKCRKEENYVLADGICSPGGQLFCIKMKFLPGFLLNYNLGMLQLVRLTNKKNVDEKM